MLRVKKQSAVIKACILGKSKGFNLWVVDYEECGTLILIGGNFFYKEDYFGKIHNKSYDKNNMIR